MKTPDAISELQNAFKSKQLEQSSGGYEFVGMNSQTPITTDKLWYGFGGGWWENGVVVYPKPSYTLKNRGVKNSFSLLYFKRWIYHTIAWIFTMQTKHALEAEHYFYSKRSL